MVLLTVDRTGEFWLLSDYLREILANWKSDYHIEILGDVGESPKPQGFNMQRLSSWIEQSTEE